MSGEPRIREFSFRVDDADATVTLRQEWIDVSTSVQPTKIDPAWSWTDPAGHRHDPALRGARWVVLYTYWCHDCRDEHDEMQLQCRLCGAEVKPRRVPDYAQPTEIPGLLEARLELRRPSSRMAYFVPPELVESFRQVSDDDYADWVASVEARPDLLVAHEVITR